MGSSLSKFQGLGITSQMEVTLDNCLGTPGFSHKDLTLSNGKLLLLDLSHEFMTIISDNLTPL